MSKKRILWIGDGVVKTGFSTVNHNIIKHLTNKYDIHHLAINYFGDPHEYKWKIYPASLGGDIWGFNRLESLVNVLEPNAIFILNDIWVVAEYLKRLKNIFDKNKKTIPIVVYFPVDGEGLKSVWFDNFNIVSKINVYTRFGYDEVLKVYDYPDRINIIPHGLDRMDFYKIDKEKNELKKELFKGDRFKDTFIVLNANRNQPRKRIDITIEGFYLFSKDKPDTRLYLHMGTKDVGWDIIDLTHKFGLHDRLILTNMSQHLPSIPEKNLNLIYNATDVGINTSTGEGWGLVNFEHASVGVPQIVAKHSSMAELFQDCGILVDPVMHQYNIDVNTKGYIIPPEGLADALNKLYYNRDLYNNLSGASLDKFSNEYYDWVNIVNRYWKNIFEEVLS